MPNNGRCLSPAIRVGYRYKTTDSLGNNTKTHWNNGSSYKLIGEAGIRTLEELTPLPVFKTGAFGHSATSPSTLYKNGCGGFN